MRKNILRCRFTLLLCLFGLSNGCTSFAQATNILAENTLEPYLRITTMRDAGGLIPPDANDVAANDLLTQGIARYLNQHAKGKFKIAPKTTIASAIRYTLEGEISHLDGAKGSGSYLWTICIFENDKINKRHLFAHFAGVAHSFEDLSGADDGIGNSAGLIGELGQRTIEAIQAQSEYKVNNDIDGTIEALKKRADVTAMIIPIGYSSSSNSLVVSSRYQVRVSNLPQGSVFVIVKSNNKALRLLNDHPIDVTTRATHPNPLLLPTSSFFLADNQVGEMKIIILIRRAKSALERGSVNNHNKQLPRIKTPYEASSGKTHAIVIGDFLDRSHSSDSLQQLLTDLISGPTNQWSATSIVLKLVKGGATSN